MMYTALFALAAYLIGSISFAVVVSKLYRLDDPRTFGSKNPGATNVLRTGNKSAAVLTLIGDAAKGWLAVWLAKTYGAQFGMAAIGLALVALAVFIGHLWPLYTKFVGGKGVATALGILIGFSPILGLMALGTWLVVAFIFRYSSLSALAAATAAPLYYGLLYGFDPNMVAIAVMSGLLIMRHGSNINNLLKGKESKIGSKKK